ncbi:MAG: prolipoprotein diacylglyceryl transferase, partial [Clostridia bacterium]|nr:prolipoprotein diacylglyceryl transferase [Clostridia bacterium]
AIIIIRRKRFGMNVRQALAFCVAVIIAGFIGCHTLYLLENTDVLLRDGWHFRGVSFFGCLLFAPAITVLLARLFGISAGNATDLLADGLPPFLGTVRIGCYCTGCCGGIPHLLEDGRIYVPPVQLIESGFDFLIFGIILILEKMHIFDRFRLPVFFVLYAPMRFVLEYYRRTGKDILGFSLAQIYSIVIFAVGAVLLIGNSTKNRRTKTKCNNRLTKS